MAGWVSVVLWFIVGLFGGWAVLRFLFTSSSVRKTTAKFLKLLYSQLHEPTPPYMVFYIDPKSHYNSGEFVFVNNSEKRFKVVLFEKRVPRRYSRLGERGLINDRLYRAMQDHAQEMLERADDDWII